MASDRHRDPGVTVWDLGPTEADPWLVECPRCARRAVRIASRVSCGACGFERTSADRPEPLWLRTPCRGESLWAVNERHLALLEGFLLARHRERRRDPVAGWRNGALGSRLPRWVKSAGAREDVAKALARLRARLGET